MTTRERSTVVEHVVNRMPLSDAAWNDSRHPALMLYDPSVRITVRVALLFGCACCRRAWRLLDPPYREAVEGMERYADEEVGDQERARLRQLVEALRRPIREDLLRATTAVERLFANWYSRQHADATAQDVQDAVSAEADRLAFGRGMPRWEAEGVGKEAAREEALYQADALRDLLPRPARELEIDPGWRTTTVQQLLEGMRTNSAPDAVPVLADALEEAGCDNPHLLDHLRQPRPHVRGCWAVEQLIRA